MEKQTQDPSPFSETTTDFVASWISGGAELTAENLTGDMEKEIQSFQEKFPFPNKTHLYRGLKAQDTINKDPDGREYVEFNWLSSWTYSDEVAELFSESRVVKTQVDSHQVFLDTTNLYGYPFDFLLSGLPEESEVILRPGKYYLLRRKSHKHKHRKRKKREKK